MSNNNGFILVQSLLSLMILCLFIPIITSCILVISRFDFIHNYQYYNQLYQLRAYLTSHDVVSIHSDYIEYDEFDLLFKNNKIYTNNGTLIFFVNVEDCFFFSYGHEIYLEMIINDKREQFLIDYE